MFKVVYATRSLVRQKHFLLSELFTNGKRLFLSDAFRCREQWERRLQAPILQNLKLDDLYHELEQKFLHEGKASVIDIDLFANAVREESYVDELEDLIHKLRLSSNAVHMLPSTSHAVIRTFLALGKNEQLLRILNDRLNYGIFPDDYCSCILMDTYIKDKRFTDAAKVGVLQMLQEDWSHPLTTYLTLYSCHMYLTEPGPWEDESPVEEEPEEEVKVRVKYIRNPYFDDHFDLRDSKLLVGKTLATLGATLPDSVGRTYQLIGLGLYKKWNKAIDLLQQFLKTKDNPVVFKLGVKMFEDIFEQHFKDITDSSEQAVKEQLTHLVTKLVSADLVCDGDLHEALMAKVQRVVELEEGRMAERQQQVYLEWEVAREVLLKEEVDRLKMQQRLAQVQREKEELVRREQELFFFDNKDKWDLIIEKKNVVPTRRYEGKRKKKKVQDENYIPPEI